MMRTSTPCTCLDFVEAVHRDRIYPLIYCHMDISGHLDMDRLKRSVSLSGRLVPEIMYACDFRKASFVNSGYTADDVVKRVTQPGPFMRRDLRRSPQLQILVVPKETGELVIVSMSHILTDGAGFLQYLYLLADIYNRGQAGPGLRNMRSISPLLTHIRVLGPTQQTRYHKRWSVSPLRLKETGSHYFCLTRLIPADYMAAMSEKAAKSGVTLNDVFMTAYARVIGRLQHTTEAVLPCPADLRRFRPGSCGLTVANMTGMYRTAAVEIPPGCPFSETLQQVHLEMQLQKSRNRCFAGIKTLDKAFRRVPRPLLGKIVRAIYRPSPVSYSNFGRIDHSRLRFKGCTVQNCFFTGTYRLSPDFQLTISTFRNICTLNCTLLGSDKSRKTGQHLLEQVAQEIFHWIFDDLDFPYAPRYNKIISKQRY